MTKTKIQYVCGFAFSESGREVALIHKKRPHWQKDHLNGIGGKIKDDELPYAAMIREFEEEAGYRTGAWQHYATINIDGRSEEITVFFFRAFFDLRHIKTMTDEPVHIIDCHPSLPRTVKRDGEVLLMIDNLMWLIPMARDTYVQDASVIENPRFF